MVTVGGHGGWSWWVTCCPERFGARAQDGAGCLEVVLVTRLWGPQSLLGVVVGSGLPHQGGQVKEAL